MKKIIAGTMKRRLALSRFRNRSLAASLSQSIAPASSSAVRSCGGFGPAQRRDIGGSADDRRGILRIFPVVQSHRLLISRMRFLRTSKETMRGGPSRTPSRGRRVIPSRAKTATCDGPLEQVNPLPRYIGRPLRISRDHLLSTCSATVRSLAVCAARDDR